MNTDALIRRLASEASPVAVLAHPSTNFARWMAFAVGFSLIGAGVIGARPDLVSALSPNALIQVGLLLVLSFSCAFIALTLGVPDRRSTWAFVGPVGGVLCATLWLIASVSSAPELHFGVGLRCLRNVLVLSLPPAWMLHRLLKQAFTLARRTVGLLTALSGSALACAVTRFICPNDDPSHFFAWHYLPALALGGIGVWVGSRGNDAA